ncbi:hypothetical protein EMIT053CA3_110109 [Pseudomonas donghuensis]
MDWRPYTKGGSSVARAACGRRCAGCAKLVALAWHKCVRRYSERCNPAFAIAIEERTRSTVRFELWIQPVNATHRSTLLSQAERFALKIPDKHCCPLPIIDQHRGTPGYSPLRRSGQPLI